MIRCDLCGATASGLHHRVIECKEFTICESCWAPIAEKLAGKGELKPCFTVQLRRERVRASIDQLQDEEVIY